MSAGAIGLSHTTVSVPGGLFFAGNRLGLKPLDFNARMRALVSCAWSFAGKKVLCLFLPLTRDHPSFRHLRCRLGKWRRQ